MITSLSTRCFTASVPKFFLFLSRLRPLLMSFLCRLLSDSFLSRSEGLDHAEEAPTRFMVASVGVLSEGCGHGGPGVCLGDGQTESYLKDTGMTGLASA